MFLLIPEPKKLRATRGRFQLARPLRVLIPDGATKGTRLALFRLMSELRTATNQPVEGTQRPFEAHIRVSRTARRAIESYRIFVGRNHIEIFSEGDPGIFYGIQTLRQLIRQFKGNIPCCEIEDEPSFPHRGFYLDISRGRVPKLDLLCQIVDTLAHLKLNQLQLYVEHVYPFEFDPEISEGCDVFTGHEFDRLREYCATWHIELVPSLACFGHMGRVLSLPQYRNLAEVPWTYATWEQAPWVARLRGLTLNPRHPKSRKLLRQMLDEFLPHFSAPYFNMCGDETYDLGKGKSRQWTAHHGLGRLYAEHVNHVHALASRHGKRLMLWGDMLHKFPEALKELPRDVVVLDWGYEPSTDFGKISRFVEAGFEAYACPATRGYKTVFNEVEKARRNIVGYARTGHEKGATGLLITDWGDMGHFNCPGASWHGIALAAALSWNHRGTYGRHFDRAFSQQMLGDETGESGTAIATLGNTNFSRWPWLLCDLPDSIFSPQDAKRARHHQELAMEWAERFLAMGLSARGAVPALAYEELSRACEALALTAEKISLALSKEGLSERNRTHLATKVMNFFDAYVATWRKGYKLLGLRELKQAFQKGIERLLGHRTALHPDELP